MVHVLSTTGAFEYLSVEILAYSGGDLKKLFILLNIATAVMSAFLDNVTTILLVAPVTIEMCQVSGTNPFPFLISQVMFSNIGGTSTQIGDVSK